jgi:hypothetical protein
MDLPANYRPLYLAAVLFCVCAISLAILDLDSAAAFARWIISKMSAGDWVAVVAAIVAFQSVWHARRSANAAEAALPIAAKSAGAAQGSADAAARSATVAEQEWTSKNSPVWRIEVGPITDGECLARATLLRSSGPIDVTGSYFSTAWTRDDAAGTRSGTPWFDSLDRWGGLVSGDDLGVAIPLPPGADIDEVELRIQLASIETKVDDDSTRRGPWFHDEFKRWRQPTEPPLVLD